MSNVIEFSQARRTFNPAPAAHMRRVVPIRTTDDYRRMLSDMRLRPSSQREFLRRFLKRAAANGVPLEFPVQVPVVVTP
jgi:hypothetical protein